MQLFFIYLKMNIEIEIYKVVHMQTKNVILQNTGGKIQFQENTTCTSRMKSCH